MHRHRNAMNPQRRYGSDVLSRIRASCDGHREELRQLVVSVLKEGVMQFEKSSTAIRGMCIAGNTTMTHLLMGYDVLSLGKSPFTPVELGLQEYQSADWEFPVVGNTWYQYLCRRRYRSGSVRAEYASGRNCIAGQDAD